VQDSTGNEILADSSSLDSAAALVEGWKVIVITVVIAVILTLAGASLRSRRYEASVTVSTIVNQRSIPLGGAGLAAQLLNLNTGAGMQATPALVARLTRMQSVLLAVAAFRPSGDSASVIERLTGRPADRVPNTTVIRTMGRVIMPSLDRETGLVTIRVVHGDSALARTIVERTVAEISRVFREASRAQATELRLAQQARLDSAESQLRHAERHLIEFLGANRLISPHSALQAQLQSLQRAVDIAQTVYLQVRSERESAVGKELEETPAVVVLDMLPATLPRLAMPLARLIVFAMVIGFAFATTILLLRERSRHRFATDPQGQERLTRALASLPLRRHRSPYTR